MYRVALKDLGERLLEIIDAQKVPASARIKRLPAGMQLWGSDRYNGVVYVVDTTSGRLLHQIRVGGQPHGLTFFPNVGRFRLRHNGVYG